ncbi:RING zinc finger protein-like protein [Myriangium duriaei CBS 260.36]|uniref:E3 ubiquitin-protein ligase listerin n=1 Tax=Myriangium duriaei CBS 260.36 TaxID=1168546 RepID=A0A9P4IZJ0_9PEZI|nr:RING zinc finger protein-like protein [Myriangium duriaei CBS 260.36]
MKKAAKSTASSGRAVAGASAFGTFGNSATFETHASPLSYVSEPPNLSAFSDSNIVVQFKNLMKKDATTKTKALEDIQTYLKSPDIQVEEALLSAYAKLYPRLSIDSSRRVRQLSHAVIGLVASKAGKRVGPYMPQIAGPWYSGQADSDRSVSRAAADALQQTFQSKEKVDNFPKLLQRQIVDYCKDAILNETPQTLSDERIVSKEDSAATYYRVISTCLATISGMVADLPMEELQKQAEAYTAVLSEKRIWELVSADDVGTRRAVYRLLSTCLSSDYLKPLLDLVVIGNVFINKALLSDQTSTATELATALSRLTEQHSSIWTIDYKGKKPPIQRLRHFFKQGSQRSPSGFWSSCLTLLRTIPVDILPSDQAGVDDLLKAVFESVTLRDERMLASEAWTAYLEIANILIGRAPADEKRRLLQERVMPIISQYLEPTQAFSQWTIPAQHSQQILAKAARCSGIPAELANRWPEVTSALIDAIKMSHPEQSKEFQQSQEKVDMASRRWVAFQSAVLTNTESVDQELVAVFDGQQTRVIHEAIAVLVARRGKPYGAASLLEQLSLRQRPAAANGLLDDIAKFLSGDAADLLFSPSQSYIFGMLYNLASHTNIDQTWDEFATTLTASIDLDHVEALTALINASREDQAVSLARKNAGVQTFLRHILDSRKSVLGKKNAPKNLMSCMSDDTKQQVLADALESLSLPDTIDAALDSIEAVDSLDPEVLHRFVAGNDGRLLLTKVASLEKSSKPSIASRANKVHGRLIGGSDDDRSGTYSVDLIRSELVSLSNTAVSMETILNMTRAAIKSPDANLWSILTELLPVWTSNLKAADSYPTNRSLATMSPLGGTILLINSKPSPTSSTSAITHDSQGLSQALRIGMFAMEIISGSQSPTEVDTDAESHILSLLLRTALMADDEMTIVSRNNAVVTRPSAAVVEFVSVVRKHIRDRLSVQDFESPLFRTFCEACLESTKSTTREAYSNAQAFVEVIREWTESNSFASSILGYLEGVIKSQRQSSNALGLAAALCALSPRISASQYLQRYCNELISVLTGAEPKTDKTLSDLILLNVILQGSEAIDGVVAKQRLVFFMKHVLGWIVDEDVSPFLKFEIYTSLQYVLPLVSDIYGEHFADIIQAISNIWQSGDFESSRNRTIDSQQLLLIYSSLRLYNVLVSLSKSEDPNEDLTDTLKDREAELMGAAVNLLVKPRPVDEAFDTPLAITNRLISRLVQRTKNVSSDTAAELYPLLDSKSTSIQEAAFMLLQRYTEQTQEQISFDAALEKKAAHLPEELLSFIFSPPAIESVLSASFETAIPEDLQSYLYSWLLIFSHFTKASLKVKEHYAEDIKTGDHLPPLLDLVYEFLGHATGNPVDVSKYDIAEYRRNQESNPEKDAEWLLAHLYYQCLMYLPSLTKTHYLSITNRRTSSSISKWIAKYFSPSIIASSMKSVSDWAASFASDPEYENFSIKLRPRAGEITAAYEVDEQSFAIMVRLPDAYPLDGARVEGLSRVSLDARKWQSWLRNCQGVIHFSNGDIVDGLASWRRNVIGALKGQTECYICYSVISADRQLPSKRCLTCKNIFHSSCLFKWFRSSNSSSCPLCRTAFNYA